MESKLENLKKAWQEYRNKTGESQVDVSKKLGWASATFGLYLNGRRQIKAEHAVSLANLLQVYVGAITDGPVADVREIDIIGTASGNVPPQKTKKISVSGAQQAIFCDIAIMPEGGAISIPAGTTLIVSEVETMATDDRWPTVHQKFWLIQSAKLNKVIVSATKPKARPKEKIYQITSALLT